ncbi:MAG: 50S ribosomal protein L9 [Fimbriimonadaceae bacterium]
MKVILKQSVPKLGKENTVVTVADGYARNFLFPRGMAIIADKNQLGVLERRKKAMSARNADTIAAAQTLKEKLEGQEVKIEGKVGRELGKLFGAVTSQDVADAISAQLKVTVEKRQVGLFSPIKKLGTIPVMIDLHAEVDATVNVTVFDPNAPVAVAEPEPEAKVEMAEEEPA